jgi:hypothetical protein
MGFRVRIGEGVKGLWIADCVVGGDRMFVMWEEHSLGNFDVHEKSNVILGLYMCCLLGL